MAPLLTAARSTRHRPTTRAALDDQPQHFLVATLPYRHIAITKYTNTSWGSPRRRLLCARGPPTPPHRLQRAVHRQKATAGDRPAGTPATLLGPCHVAPSIGDDTGNIAGIELTKQYWGYAATGLPVKCPTAPPAHCGQPSADAHLSASHPQAPGLLGPPGLRPAPAYDMEVGAGTSHTATFLRAIVPSRGAPLRAAVAPAEGRPLRREPEPHAALLPVPGGAEAVAAGHPRPLSRSLEALGFDLRKNDVRFVEDDWENPRSAPGLLGGVAERDGGDAVHLLPAGRRPRLQPDHARYLRARAPRDVLQGKENVFDLVWTHGRSAASGASSRTATSTTRTRSSSRPTTSSSRTRPGCSSCSRSSRPRRSACSKRSWRCPATR